MSDAQQARQIRHRQQALADKTAGSFAIIGPHSEILGLVECIAPYGPLPPGPWPEGSSGILAQSVIVAGPDVPGPTLTFTKVGDPFVLVNLGNGTIPGPSPDGSFAYREMAYSYNGEIVVIYDQS